MENFALACVGLGVLIEVVVVVGAQGDAAPRDPEVTAAMMKATQYGKAETVDLPTSAGPTRASCSSACRRLVAGIAGVPPCSRPVEREG